ncbi:hypothetical protein [Actinomadura alba]|uniref:hypothetical protein n=1 Tax=Actinomadura alba TaxID=406431 RepID=UPI0031D09603
MTIQQDPPLSWEDLAEFPPGPHLAFALTGVDLVGLPDVELVAVMVAARRQTSWTQSLELAAVAELSRRRHDQERGLGARGMGNLQINDIVVDEVALTLTLTGTAAAGWVCRAAGRGPARDRGGAGGRADRSAPRAGDRRRPTRGEAGSGHQGRGRPVR